MAAHPIRYYWEDLTVGSSRELGSVSPGKDDILAFARQFDPQPFHLDESAAKESIFGALCASGWHTCALAMRLMVDNFLCQSSSLGSPGLESLKWPKPVFADDSLRLRQTVLDTRPMNSRPDVGLVRTRWEMRNQRDELVLLMEGWGMFRRRTPGTATR